MSYIDRINVQGTEYDVLDRRVRLADGQDFDYGTLVQGGINNNNGYTTGAHLRRSETYWPVIEGPVNVIMQNGLTGYIRLYDADKTMIDPGEGMPGSDTTNHVLVIAKNTTMTLTMKEYNPNTAYFRFYFSCGTEDNINALVRENARIVPLQTVATSGEMQTLSDDVSDLKSAIGELDCEWNDIPITRMDGAFKNVTVGTKVTFGTQDYYGHVVIDVTDIDRVKCNFWYITSARYYGVFTNADDIILENQQFYIENGTYNSAKQITGMEADVPLGATKFYLQSSTNDANFNARTKVWLGNTKNLQTQITEFKNDVYGTDGAYGTATGNYIGKRIRLQENSRSFDRNKIVDIGDDFSPSVAFTSTAAQGMAIYNGFAFGLLKEGGCIVYDLENSAIVGQFVLPVSGSTMHCNSADFSNEFYDSSDDFPLLYVSGTNGPNDSKCYVFRVTINDATLIQTIEFDNQDGDYTGSFDWIVDCNLYGATSDYRKIMTWGNGANGTHPVKVFDLPGINETYVTLSSNDILREFVLEDYMPADERISVYQGHTMYGDYLMLVDGAWQNNKIHFFDRLTMEYIGRLYSKTLMPYEFEDVCVYDGKLYCYMLSANGYGQYYAITFRS